MVNTERQRDIVEELEETCACYDLRNPTFALLKRAAVEIRKLRGETVEPARMRRVRHG